ncbi:MAG: AhpC/TSA family protein [Bacteroidaceae bacterium]|nr:AhpC/TSA family protein [Bacteroidaceae bacterium]
MKKLFYFAALVLTLCVAACQNGGNKVTGSVNGGQDGDTVVIASMEFDTLQTTVIKNGTFSFEGVQDSAQLCYILWKSNANPETSIGAIVALEGAAITVKMDTAENVASEISGSPANEALSTLNKTEQEINKEAQAIFAVLSDTAATEEAQAAAQQQIEALSERMEELYKNFVSSNIQNIAGQAYLAQYASVFDDEFVCEQLAAVPADALSAPLRDLKKLYDEKAATAVGQPFKDIKAATPEGGDLSVSEVAANAKVLLIDFWASWCGPCRQEMPNVKAAYEKYHAQGFEIIGVSLDSDGDAWKKAIADLGMTWPQISDLKGWEAEGAQTYTVRAIPATVLIKDGKIVARDLRGEELAQKVAELLAE